MSSRRPRHRVARRALAIGASSVGVALAAILLRHWPILIAAALLAAAMLFALVAHLLDLEESR